MSPTNVSSCCPSQCACPLPKGIAFEHQLIQPPGTSNAPQQSSGFWLFARSAGTTTSCMGTSSPCIAAAHDKYCAYLAVHNKPQIKCFPVHNTNRPHNTNRTQPTGNLTVLLQLMPGAPDNVLHQQLVPTVCGKPQKQHLTTKKEGRKDAGEEGKLAVKDRTYAGPVAAASISSTRNITRHSHPQMHQAARGQHQAPWREHMTDGKPPLPERHVCQIDLVD